jgi:hypothetical protein
LIPETYTCFRAQTTEGIACGKLLQEVPAKAREDPVTFGRLS